MNDVAAPPPTGSSPLVVVANRAPVSFDLVDGTTTARRGAGGLVSGLGPLVVDTDALWIAAAMSPGDRVAATQGVIEAEGYRTHLLDIEPTTFAMAYDVVCNATLWFLHHRLFDLSHRPRFDGRWREAWDAYREVNARFAAAVIADAAPGAVVLAQDYHLALLAPPVVAARPDLRLVHFAHTPFAGPDDLRVLPDAVAAELLEGLSAAHACGFHTVRWAKAFTDSCTEVLGRAPRTYVSPLAPDAADIGRAASSPAAAAGRAWLDEVVGDRQLVVRVDRIELSKNLLRGFHAFDDLFERYPRWRERVTFGAFVYPSREGLAEYRSYRQQVEALVERVNRRWGTPDWTPILFETTDDYPRSVAALTRYDVLMVNPISDGLNLVAKEGPLVNDQDGVLLLSPEAGAWAELGEHALRVNPFDVAGTADALDRALSMDRAERARRAAALRAIVRSRTPADWLADQLTAAGPPPDR